MVTRWPTTKPSWIQSPDARVTSPPPVCDTKVTATVFVRVLRYEALTSIAGWVSTAPVACLSHMTVLSVVSSGWSSLKPMTSQVSVKPEMCSVWPTRKPCAFQSKGCGLVSRIVEVWVTPLTGKDLLESAVAMTVPVSFTAASGSSVPWT